MAIDSADLARRYGASRGTLERVMDRLSEEGLIARGIGHAWHFVPSLEGEGGVAASYAYRSLLEPEAIQLPGFSIAPQGIQALRQRHLALIAAPARAFGLLKAHLHKAARVAALEAELS